jgi:hypothetical protein
MSAASTLAEIAGVSSRSCWMGEAVTMMSRPVSVCAAGAGVVGVSVAADAQAGTSAATAAPASRMKRMLDSGNVA